MVLRILKYALIFFVILSIVSLILLSVGMHLTSKKNEIDFLKPGDSEGFDRLMSQYYLGLKFNTVSEVFALLSAFSVMIIVVALSILLINRIRH